MDAVRPDQDLSMVSLQPIAPRITDWNATNWEAPGKLSRILKKLRSERRQVSRGTACARCRSRKIKCDGRNPCKHCVTADVHCILKAPVPESPIPIENLVQTPIANHRPLNDYSPDDNNILTHSLIDLGWKRDRICLLFASLPQPLRRALTLLAKELPARLGGVQATKPELPSDLDMWNNSATVGKMFIRICPMTGNKTVQFNSISSNRLGGAHPEEISARAASMDSPMMMSEYRLICWHLEVLFQMISGKNDFSLLIPMLKHQFHDTKERWELMRINSRFFNNGVITTGSFLLGEEYDCGADSECNLRAEHFLSAESNIKERESIFSMMQTGEGRRKLDFLARQVVTCFGLQGAGH